MPKEKSSPAWMSGTRPQSYSKERILNSTFQTVHFDSVTCAISQANKAKEKNVPVKIIHLNVSAHPTKQRIFP